MILLISVTGVVEPHLTFWEKWLTLLRRLYGASSPELVDLLLENL